MNRRAFFGALALGVLGLGAGASGAQAQFFVRDYRRYRYFPGRGPEDIRRREALRLRMFMLADRIEDGQRRGIIGPHAARRLYQRLDDVADFLRHDRNLTRSEFDRRRDDLDDIAEDLREWIADSRGGRFVRRRGGRYWDDDWFDRYDRRFRRSSRYYRW